MKSMLHLDTAEEDTLLPTTALHARLNAQMQVLHVSEGLRKYLGDAEWTPEFSTIQNLHPFRERLPNGHLMLFTPILTDTPEQGCWLLIGTQQVEQETNQFLSYAFHELRTPISALFSWSELLKNNMLQTPAEILEAHQILFGESYRLSEFLTKLLHFFRMESGRMLPVFQPIHISQLLQKVLAQAKALAEHHQVSLFLEAEEPQTGLQGDEQMLEIALGSLVENAILCSPKGGDVELRLEVEDRWFHIEIQDQGPGFPLELLEELLRPYHCAIPNLPHRFGIGIGLPMANKILQMHHAVLKFSRNAKAGTTVKISLLRS